MLIDLITEDGLEPQHKSGDEYSSPCPACGGTDRFIVHADSGRFWCRQCNIKGDVIDYLRQFRGMTFKEAAEFTGKSNGQTASPTSPMKRDCKSSVDYEPSPLWIAQVEILITASHQYLLNEPGKLDELRFTRGLSRETVEQFRLGWWPNNLFDNRSDWGLPEEMKADGTPKKLFIPAGLIIPGPNRVRIRRSEPGNFGKYYVLPGSGNWPLIIDAGRMSSAIVVESELDAFLLSQELTDHVTIIATGSTSNGPTLEMIQDLSERPHVLIALDTDEAGAKAAWKRWMEVLPNAVRALLPGSWNAKDHTEAFLQGHDLNVWFHATLKLTETIVPDSKDNRNRDSNSEAKSTDGNDDLNRGKRLDSVIQCVEMVSLSEVFSTALPDWCRADCEHFRHQHLPGLEPVIGCEIVTAPDRWVFRRIDSMAGCPKQAAIFVLPRDPKIPGICRDCDRLEGLEIQGRKAYGCRYRTSGDYPDGWRRLPAHLHICLQLTPPE